MIDDVVKRALAPILKADGYRKKGRNFRRSLDRCVQVVNVQSSSSSTREHARFTINLGVFYPEVDAVLASFLRSSIGADGPAESQCHLRERVGHLAFGQDTWWDLHAGAAPDPVAAAVESAFVSHGRPWLASMSDFATARAAAGRRGGPAIEIGFALAAGDRDAAAALVARWLAERPNATALIAFARTQGLVV